MPKATESAPAKAEPKAEAGAAPKMVGFGALKEIADSYHVPYDMETLRSIADEKFEVSEDQVKAFTEQVKEQAKGLFPTMAKAIDGGLKPEHLLSPYTEVAKKVMQNPDLKPDFAGDDMWKAALHGGKDPKTEMPTPMGLDQWADHIRTDERYGWNKTEKGLDAMRQVHQHMYDMMGVKNGK